MENNEASSLAAPTTKKRSIEWVWDWSLQTCLLQFTRAAVKSNLPADLKLLTPSQAANALALQNAMLWFSDAGAGAAVLATLLKEGRARIRRALACVGLACAVAIHCVLTWLLGVTIVTSPSDNLNLVVLSVVAAVGFVFFAVVDVNVALVLLGRPGWDWLEE